MIALSSSARDAQSRKDRVILIPDPDDAFPVKRADRRGKTAGHASMYTSPWKLDANFVLLSAKFLMRLLKFSGSPFTMPFKARCL